MISCYGKLYQATAFCAGCRYAFWCRTAADPPLYAKSSPAPEHLEYVIRRETARRLGRRPAADEREPDERRYSRAELIEVIGFMAALDHRVLALLEEKINHPALHLADLARKKGVSRQALHRMVTQRLSRIPELASVITYHRHRNKIDKETNFMEEVWLIRQRVRSKHSLPSRKNSNCWKNWNCLNPSLLSSPTNIIKGTAIWRSGSGGLMAGKIQGNRRKNQPHSSRL